MSVSLVSGWFPVVVPTLTVLAVVAGVDWRSRRRRRSLGGAVVTAALLAVAAWWAQARWRFVPYDVAVATYVWIGLVVLTVVVPVAAVLADRADRSPTPPAPAHRSRRRRAVWVRVTASVAAVPLAVASTAVALNAQYAYYPTLGSLQGDSSLAAQSLDAFDHARHQWGRHHATDDRGSWSVDPANPVTTDPTTTTSDPRASSSPGAAVQPGDRPGKATAGPVSVPGHLPAGSLIQVEIPGPVSGFHGRTAWVWAPPLYVAGYVDRPPVVMMLAGSPGQTSDWIRGGNAVATAQRWADEHHGAAPMLVFPDANGSPTADTECVDSHLGNAETYLTRDVPAFLGDRFGVVAHRWSIVGLSEGGECATMLALRHSDLFSAFADFSGLTSPTLTERVDRAATARDLFGGDARAYDAHDPMWLLAHAPPRSLTAYWQTGADDHRTRAAQRSLVALATAAGMPVHAVETPGQNHDFTFWSEAFAASLPTLVTAMPGGPPGR